MQTARFLAAALLVGVATAAKSQADTAQSGPAYIVNVKTDHDDGVCGNSDCTLREAINAGNNAVGANMIQFASNVRGTITLTGGELLITDTLTIEGPGANLLSIDANNMSRVLNAQAGFGVTISGLTLTRGFTNLLGGGGCIYNLALLTLNRCTISDSTAMGPTETGNGLGGGIRSGNQIGSEDHLLELSNCTISGNSAIALDAPPRSIGEAGGVAYGGGIFLYGGNVSMSLVNCTFSGNAAVGGNGSTLAGGGAGGDGQGGAISSDGVAAIAACTFSGNSATGGLGGGVGMFKAPDGNGSGGGLYNFVDEFTRISGTIFAGNSASTGGPDVAGSITSQGYNLVGKSDGSAGFTEATDHTGTIAAPLDPKLDPAGLQNNGGFTETIALLSGSLAINNGDANTAPARDQRNYVRKGRPDIGAFEFHGTIPGQLFNISTRGFVQTGNNLLIGGLIVTGNGPKNVLLRALGPTLGQPPFNVPGTLANPSLSLFQGSSLVDSNDNWTTATNKQAIVNTGLAPANSLESAILIELNPGNYTGIVRGVNNTTGNALFEAYDLDNTAGSKLGNISTRGFVQTGNNVMIAGVIVHGPDSENVLIRALGPTLAQPPFNVPNSLHDPFLDLRDGNGTQIAGNDNWKNVQRTQIEDTGLAPPNDAESAIAIILAPGNYTAIVTGVNNTTGNALIEVYGLN